ncbi:MAG: hypothetical protein KDB07_08705 [Planctomycetes bacterium]|nr:hypothetical protein [Planctomycetota bacterium]
MDQKEIKDFVMMPSHTFYMGSDEPTFNTPLTWTRDGEVEMVGWLRTLEEFARDYREATLLPCDGHGVLAKYENGELLESNVWVNPRVTLTPGQIPDWATHVIWYNK